MSMFRQNSILTVGVVALLTLAGCTTPSKTTTENSPAASPAMASPEAMSSPASSSAMSSSTMSSSTSPQKYGDLHQVVAQTSAAVQTGDFNKAQQEFDQFESHWSKVEDGIKAKSSDVYGSIEDGTDQVKSSLKQSNKEKSLAALKSLDGDIDQAAKL
jgi:hypothetical protein